MINTHYKFLLGKFKEWMRIENYQPETVDAYSEAFEEFCSYLQSNDVTKIQLVEQKHLTAFKNYLLVRKNRKTGAHGISNVTINGIIKGINCFTKHLNQTSESFRLDLYEDYLPTESTPKVILTTQEVMKMYNATFEQYSEGSLEMGQRDRVMLAIFYGCGLRLNEGRNLNVSDIDFEQRRVLVRYGKGKKERYVPIPNKHFEDIKDFVQQGREWFMYRHSSNLSSKRPTRKSASETDSDALFLSQRGVRMKSFQSRLNKLAQLTGIEKKVGTHLLRHSVATHLLIGGWKLEMISKFLGHSSIDSTQIYTQIVEQLKEGDE